MNLSYKHSLARPQLVGAVLPLAHLQVLQMLRLQVRQEEGRWCAAVDLHFHLEATTTIWQIKTMY